MRAVSDARQRRGSRRGLTLVELAAAMVLSGVVVAALWRMLDAGGRFFREQASVVEARRALRDAAEVLGSELRPLDPSGGDLVALGPDSISLRAHRSLAFVCAPPDAAAGRIAVFDSLLFGFRAVDPARDRALVFLEGDPRVPEGDGWLDFGIASVGEASCDGRPGTGLVLQGGTAALDAVTVGSPVRTYERVVYRTYADGDGAWWLGQRAFSGGAWAPISPVAGPLQAGAGLECRALDTAGGGTTDLLAAARVECEVRALSSEVLQEPGGRQRRFADSLRISVAPRNGRRGGS